MTLTPLIAGWSVFPMRSPLPANTTGASQGVPLHSCRAALDNNRQQASRETRLTLSDWHEVIVLLRCYDSKWVSHNCYTRVSPSLPPQTHVCGVENVDNPLQCGVALPLLLLAYQLDVPQLSKVKVPLLLHVLDGGFQNAHLHDSGTTEPQQ